jgi:hypothetical protein
MTTYHAKKSTRRPSSGAKTARQLLYWLAICVACVVAAANMLPYCRAVSLALINIFDLQGVVGFFGNRALALISIPLGSCCGPLSRRQRLTRFCLSTTAS